MTPAQQMDLFGVCAMAQDGKVIIESRGPVELDPQTARRFMFYLARAHQDALHRERRRNRPTTATIEAWAL